MSNSTQQSFSKQVRDSFTRRSTPAPPSGCKQHLAFHTAQSTISGKNTFSKTNKRQPIPLIPMPTVRIKCIEKKKNARKSCYVRDSAFKFVSNDISLFNVYCLAFFFSLMLLSAKAQPIVPTHTLKHFAFIKSVK